MIKFYSLSSGSSGNSAFIKYNNTNILIDCGISAKRIKESLYSIGESSVDAILITHEHSDHICGLKVLTKAFCVPVYATAPTWEQLEKVSESIPLFNKQIAIPGKTFFIGDIDVTPVLTSHDSALSVGYIFNCGGTKYALATDNGRLTGEFAEYLKGCDTALIEANYDEEMLENGPYPYPLKKRIASHIGHMSNSQAAKLACALSRSGTKRIVLGHLSKENNTPSVAYNTVKEALKNENLSVSLKVAERYDITNLLENEIKDLDY